jgi:hypothetical protein
MAISDLSGNDWGQYGDLVFFVQIAYRDKEGLVKSLQCVHFFWTLVIITDLFSSACLGMPDEG